MVILCFIGHFTILYGYNWSLTQRIGCRKFFKSFKGTKRNFFFFINFFFLIKKKLKFLKQAYRITLRIIIASITLLLPLSELNSLNLVEITSMLTLFLVLVEMYGKLRKDKPLFGKCDEDIIGNKEMEGKRRYIRWRWGPN